MAEHFGEPGRLNHRLSTNTAETCRGAPAMPTTPLLHTGKKLFLSVRFDGTHKGFDGGDLPDAVDAMGNSMCLFGLMIILVFVGVTCIVRKMSGPPKFETPSQDRADV